MIDRLIEFTQSRGEFLDLSSCLLGLAGQGLLTRVDLVQQEPVRVLPGHAGRQDGLEVPVNRRAITSLIAQYTRD
ncbi:hypothetical protein SAMN04489713_1243 [Actinomadura madurae]|uniref:Uncharacterized protein n=1 Tax=Actinomadura madurae TaxID=1993 RepID=A0A1I5WJJ8_9ACTN|nr:hypothetical protein SAMN04489713_1243 [Actinomadura madurae]SPT51839.1 Uncharacterised protein [Actinomadura madurae]